MPPSSTKLAVITGASSGIGRSLALLLAEQGYDLFLVARREQELSDLASEIRVRFSVEVGWQSVDLSAPAPSIGGSPPARASAPSLGASASARPTSHFLDEISQIKILVNNAGYNHFSALSDQPSEEWSKILDLNCRAVVDLSQRAAKKMSAGSTIVNVSSLAADIPLPYMAVYSASKAFVTNFSCALREELKPRGIAVISVNPGAVRTDFVVKAGMPGRVNREQDRLLVSADYVARGIWRAIRRGSAVYVPVRSGYFLHALLFILPRPWKAWLAARSYRAYLK